MEDVRTASVKTRPAESGGERTAYLFGFHRWKTYMSDWLSGRRTVRTHFFPSTLEFHLFWRWVLSAERAPEVFVWQYKGPAGLDAFCRRRGIPLHYVEDGFIRSISLGALHTPPLSLVFDRAAPHFNAQVETDLERLLNTYDFDSDPALLARARKAMAQLIDARLSKYNMGERRDMKEVYGPKAGKRVLVIGQVERDASIRYGCDRTFRNNDLVRLAAQENPGAQVIYKPHPETLHGTAGTLSDPEEVASICHILRQDISLADAFETVDHVYTITSLSGFEALMRGIPVTTVGCPFYSGWGLTDERQPNPRRKRSLSVDEVFAGAYILYAKYINPLTAQRIEIEDAIALLDEMRKEAAGSRK